MSVNRNEKEQKSLLRDQNPLKNSLPLARTWGLNRANDSLVQISSDPVRLEGMQ